MGEPENTEDNRNTITISVNSKLYPLEAVYSAAYVFMDRAYIVLDGDPEKEIIVKIKPKSGCLLENIEGEFNNELLNYADYLTRAKETKKIREMFLQRAILSNDPEMISEKNSAGLEPEEEPEEVIFLKDPESIAVPWEEKYGKNPKSENEDKAKQ